MNMESKSPKDKTEMLLDSVFNTKVGIIYAGILIQVFKCKKFGMYSMDLKHFKKKYSISEM